MSNYTPLNPVSKRFRTEKQGPVIIQNPFHYMQIDISKIVKTTEIVPGKMEITILLKRLQRVGGYSQYCKRPKKILFLFCYEGFPNFWRPYLPGGRVKDFWTMSKSLQFFFMAYLRIKIILKNQQRPFDCLANPFKDFSLSLYNIALLLPRLRKMRMKL